MEYVPDPRATSSAPTLAKPGHRDTFTDNVIWNDHSPCYMEVAVIRSYSPSPLLRRFACSLALCAGLASLASVVGCADSLSFAEDHRREGIKLYNEGRYTEAAGAFNAGVRSNPRDFPSYYWLGQSLERDNEYVRAVQAYRTGLDVMPITQGGKFSSAEWAPKFIDAIAAAVAKSPAREADLNSIEAAAFQREKAQDFFVLARSYAACGDADSAINAYNKAVALAPRDFYYAKTYGLYLEQLAQSAPAETQLRKAYALNAQDAEVNAALRRLGIVPGPSLLSTNDLARPIVPKGPIPELRLGGGSAAAPAD
jgi:tetratricopeptide (TPR) repeat protein